MEEFEKKAIDNYHLKPKLWLRHVDDIFMVWPHGRDALEEFITYLDGIHPKIKFSREMETNNRISFLDVDLYRNNRGSFTTKVFRKKTHTNRYLHFESFGPLCVKKGVLKTLAIRAKTVCSNETLQEEMNLLQSIN